jgi:transcriptional repressor NrdR
VRRRRQCEKCGYRFTTYERIDPVKFTVIKSTGKHQPYDREKLIRGMAIATEKRDVSPETLDEIADRIEQKLLRSGKPEVTSRQIGNCVIAELRELDEIAYLRFTSVYRDFKTKKAFTKEIEKLEKNK